MELLDICVGDDGIIGHMFVLLLIIAMKIKFNLVLVTHIISKLVLVTQVLVTHIIILFI